MADSDWLFVKRNKTTGQYKTDDEGGGGGGGGGSSTFAGLDDVSFNNVQNGQIPKYNSETQKWENANESEWHEYSTEERMIGKWIDGKPLYEKTIYCGDFTGSGNKETAHNISNLGRVVKMFGAFNEGATRYPLPIVMWGSAVTYQTRLAVDNTNIIISRDTASQSVNIYVTLQYTKTTD